MKEDNIFSELREEYNQSHDKRITSNDLSAIFISQGYTTLKPQRIRDIESGIVKRLRIDEYKAYSYFFGVSVDYLLGLTKAKSKDEDMKMICDTTGLSEESVKNLKEMKTAKPLQKALFNKDQFNFIDFICKDLKELQYFERLFSEYAKLKEKIDRLECYEEQLKEKTE